MYAQSVQERLKLLIKKSSSGISTRREHDRWERSMDWFERLTGFRETNYDDTRAKLSVEGSGLRSLVNGKNLMGSENSS
jgi:hypothetical protein